MSSSQNIGNAGEHYALACLLFKGYHVGLADRGNPHFDLLVRTPAGEFRAVRVKTTRGTGFQWTAKATWDPLPGFDKDAPDARDITVLVAFHDAIPGADTEVYVIPTARLVADINGVHRHYHDHKNRDGSERTWSTQRVIRLDGEKRRDNIAYGFREDWAEFKDAWHLIETPASAAPLAKRHGRSTSAPDHPHQPGLAPSHRRASPSATSTEPSERPSRSITRSLRS